jgi:uncharacterized protein (DUF2062 family)
MLRKRVQKLLPSHESIKANRTIALFGSALQHPGLWHLNRRSVAGGVAVGLFCGLIPGPLQMLGSVLLSILLRVNLPVALVATFYSNPFTIVPLYYVAYKLGVLVTGGANAAQPVQPPELSLSNPGEWIPTTFAWVTSMGKPLAIGLPLLAGILAVSGYFAVLGAWRLYVVAARRKRARAR